MARLIDAVEAYREVLEVRNRRQVPIEWAETSENLGLALALIAERSGDCGAAQRGVQALEDALEVFSAPQLAWNRDKAAGGLSAARAVQGLACRRKRPSE